MKQKRGKKILDTIILVNNNNLEEKKNHRRERERRLEAPNSKSNPY